MSDADATPPPSPTPTPRPARKPWQVGLLAPLLLTAAVAVWLTDAINGRRVAELQARIAALRPLVRELEVADPSRGAVVKLEELWYDENRWDLYLPEGRYRLCLATRGVEGAGLKLAEPVAIGRLGPGRHTIALDVRRDGEGWLAEALIDGSARVVAREPLGWNPERGSTGGSPIGASTGFDPAAPAVLFRRVFARPVLGPLSWATDTPDGPADGVLLWIEREP